MYSNNYGDTNGGNRKRGRESDDQNGGNTRRRYDLDQPLSAYPTPRGGYDSREFSGGYGGGGGRRGGRGPSHYGGGRGDGGMAGFRNKHDPRDFQVILSVGEKFCVDLWRFGDEPPTAPPAGQGRGGGGADSEQASRFTNPNSTEDLEGLKVETRDFWSKGSKEEILRGFRIAIAECPHKLPHYATLLALLSQESFTPPPSRLPAKPLVTTSNPDGTATTTSGDADMQQQPATPAPPQAIYIGLEIVKDLVKTFQRHLDARRWRSVRFYLHLFAHLASLPKPLISASSLLELLHQSFVTALENELGLRAERGDELVRVVLETLLRLNNDGLKSGGEGEEGTLAAIARGVESYMTTRELDWKYLTGEERKAQWVDPIEALFTGFKARLSSGTDLPAGLSEPFRLFTSLLSPSSSFEPLSLPIISLPPETDDSDPTSAPTASAPSNSISSSAASEEAADFSRDQVGYSGTRVLLGCERFFTASNASAGTVPEYTTNNGLYLRTLVVDLVNVFEINRKDCARILLKDLVKWLPEGTFSASTAPARASAADAGDRGENSTMEVAMSTEQQPSTLVLENLLLETILSQLFSSPVTPKRTVYYHALITELCKVSPQTVAPALGKCLRKLFAGLGSPSVDDESIVLSAEGIRRYAEWFAIHLSNFGFHWRWPEWESSLLLRSSSHPQKVFIARVLELETRLSYYDRIKATLPDTYLASSAVFPKIAPSPDFTYEAEGTSAYVAQAAEIQRLMRSRATIDEVKELLEGYKKDFVEGEIGDLILSEENAEKLKRDLVTQVVLVIGSRSFSHFLNILERYLVLLRELTDSPEHRLNFLRSCARFWSTNPQFLYIVFDKLLQYRLIDPIDMVTYLFTGDTSTLLNSLDGTENTSVQPREWSDVNSWEILKLTVEKVQNRVKGSRARLEALKKKEENRLDAERAKLQKPGQDQEMAGGAITTITNGSGAIVEGAAGTSGDAAAAEGSSAEELAKIEALVESVQKEQEALLVEVVKRFHALLSESNTEAPASDSAASWDSWFALGWWDEFVRAFAKDLYKHGDALASLALPADSIVGQGLDRAYAWVDFA